MNTNNVNIAAYMGPGLWYGIHVFAVNATTDELKKAFVIYINAICDKFPCQKCQTHFRSFIDKTDFKKYWDKYDADGNDVGMFTWSWEIHNKVNEFLKKPTLSQNEAYKQYTSMNGGVCHSCGDNSKNVTSVDSNTQSFNRKKILNKPPVNDYNNILSNEIPSDASQRKSRYQDPSITIYNNISAIDQQLKSDNKSNNPSIPNRNLIIHNGSHKGIITQIGNNNLSSTFNTYNGLNTNGSGQPFRLISR